MKVYRNCTGKCSRPARNTFLQGEIK